MQHTRSVGMHSALLTHGKFAGTFMAPSSDELYLQMSDNRKLLPFFQAALLAYQTRATDCGQTFEHMILLEAAVQGWYVSGLLLALQFPGIRQACKHLCQEGTFSL